MDEQASPPPLNFAMRTSDVDEFIDVIDRLFGHHRIVEMGGPRLMASVLAKRCNELVVGQLHYGVDVTLDIDLVRPGWVVSHVLGHEGQRDEDKVVPGDLLMYQPDWRGMLMFGRETLVRNTFIPNATMHEALKTMLGSEPDKPIVFGPLMDRTSPRAERLRQLIDILYTADTGSPTFTFPLRQAWERTFAMELLSSWPHSYSRHLAQPTLLPHALRTAREYIAAHINDPIDVMDIAKAASVGVRTLEMGFLRHFGASPMRYVREQRVQAARRSLAAPDIRPPTAKGG